MCNDKRTTSEYSLESGYVAWKSGKLVPGLGFNAIELSGGNQNYQVIDGFLFWDGGEDCAGRGGNWLSPRNPSNPLPRRAISQDQGMPAVSCYG